MISTMTPYRWVALGVAVVGLALAALLLFWPDAFAAANRVMKTWVSTEALEQKLNRTRDIDAHLMRGRKVIGIALLALSAFCLGMLFR